MKNLLKLHIEALEKHQKKYKDATHIYAKSYDPSDPVESKQHSKAFKAMNHHKGAIDSHEIAVAHLKANTPSAIFYSNQANTWPLKVNESMKTLKEFLSEARKVMYPRNTGTSSSQAAAIGQQKHAIRDKDTDTPDSHEEEIHTYKYLLSKTNKDSSLHKHYSDKLAYHTVEHKKQQNKITESKDDYISAAKLALELTTYANSLKTDDPKAQLAHYKAFEAHFAAYDSAHTDPKHKKHLKIADQHLTKSHAFINEMAGAQYTSGLQKSVDTLHAHLKRHGLEHTLTHSNVNRTLKSLGHTAQITHHEGMHDIRKVTDSNKPAPSAAEMIVRHIALHGKMTNG